MLIPGPLRALAAVSIVLATSLPGAAHAAPAARAPGVGAVSPTVETDPVGHGGDAADDPAIWVNSYAPAKSVVIGNDKLGALEVYDLTGHRIQRISEGFFGNVDVAYDFPAATGRVDIAVVYRLGMRVYGIDPNTRKLSNITDTPSGSIASSIPGEGLCLYRSPADGSTYVFVNARDGRVAQYQLTDNDRDGRVEGTLRRSFDVGTETEGCVADDVNGDFYISEENVGIWKYDAEPGAAAGAGARVLVDVPVAKGGHFIPDAEGLALVHDAVGSADGYLIASSQAASNTNNSYVVYRLSTHAFVRSFKVVAGPGGDGCGRTDGIAAVTDDLGPAFPGGLFVCQDGDNTAPNGGNQNFKLVPLERILALL